MSQRRCLAVAWLGLLTRAAALSVAPEPWDIDPNSINYTWPWVHSYCYPCKEDVAGSCFLGGCYDWRGNTTCTLMRCVCAKGYCATEASPGIWRCTPQLCMTGPRPLPYHPKTSVRFLNWLGGEPDFPSDTIDPAHPQILGFATSVLQHSTWVLVLGAASLLVSGHTFCKYKPPKRRRPALAQDGADSSPSQPGEKNDLVRRMTQQMSKENLSKQMSGLIEMEKVYTKPKARGLVTLTCVVVCLCVVGAHIRSGNWANQLQRIHKLTARSRSTAQDLSNLTSIIESRCLHLNESIVGIVSECQSAPYIAQVGPDILNYTEQYVGLVVSLHQSLLDLPALMDSGQEVLRRNAIWGYWVPLLPVVFMTVTTGIMAVLAIFVTTLEDPAHMRLVLRSQNCWIVSYVLLSILTTILCLVCFALGSVFSSFCVECDQHVLEIVRTVSEEQNMTDLHDLARFYIDGWGTRNPAMHYAHLALQHIELITTLYRPFKGVLHDAGMACPPLRSVDLDQIFDEARFILKRVTELLQPANLYPFYDDILHGVLCGEVVPSLANFLLLTFVVGLVLFPASAILTHRYLIRWMHWKLGKDGTFDDGESQSADSDTDSEAE